MDYEKLITDLYIQWVKKHGEIGASVYFREMLKFALSGVDKEYVITCLERDLETFEEK